MKNGRWNVRLTAALALTCGGCLASCERAPQPASTAQAPAAATADANADWQALEQMASAGPPRPREEMDDRAFFEWRDQNARKYFAAALAYAQSHPRDPRRWGPIVQAGYTPPLFITGFKPEFDILATDGNLIVDEQARQEFRQRHENLLRELQASADAPEHARAGAAGLLIDYAEQRARHEPSTESRAALLAEVERFIARFPDHGAVTSAVEKYMGVLESQAPAEAKAYATELEARKLPALVAQAEEQRLQNESLTDVGTLKFTAMDGREVDLARWRGKVVLVDFWATWCSPCIAELPNLKDVYERYHDRGFEVVGVALDSETQRDELLDLIDRMDLPWPQHFDGQQMNNELAMRYRVYRIPAMFLLDKQGRVASTDARGEELEAAVRRQLGL